MSVGGWSEAPLGARAGGVVEGPGTKWPGTDDVGPGGQVRSLEAFREIQVGNGLV